MDAEPYGKYRNEADFLVDFAALKQQQVLLEVQIWMNEHPKATWNDIKQYLSEQVVEKQNKKGNQNEQL